MTNDEKELKKKLNKIAFQMYSETFEDCDEEQQKTVYGKYYREEEKIGVCQACGTHVDYDVFKCPHCGAPIDKPLRSEGLAQFKVTISVKGNDNTIITGVIGSVVNVGKIDKATFS